MDEALQLLEDEKNTPGQSTPGQSTPGQSIPGQNNCSQTSPGSFLCVAQAAAILGDIGSCSQSVCDILLRNICEFVSGCACLKRRVSITSVVSVYMRVYTQCVYACVICIHRGFRRSLRSEIISKFLNKHI